MIFTFLLFIAYHISFAQLPSDPSLLMELLSNSNDDSLKAEIYNELSWQTRLTKPEQARVHALKALDIAGNAGLSSVKATSLNRIGEVERLAKNYPESIKYFERALKIERSNNHLYGVGRALGQLTTLSINIGNYKKALEYGHEGLEVFKKIKNFRSMTRSQQRLATAYYRIGDYDRSIQFNEITLQNATLLGDQKLIATSEAVLGELYSVLGIYSKSLAYNKRSLTHWIEQGNMQEASKIYLNMGSVYIKLDSLEKAEQLIKQSLEIKEFNGISNVAPNYNNLALVAEKQGAFSRAEELYLKSLELRKDSKNLQDLAIAHYNLGNIRNILNMKEAAMASFNTSLELSKESGYPRLMKKIYWELTRLHMENDDISAAKSSISAYQQLRDTTRKDLIETLQLVDRFEDQQISNDLLEKDNQIKAVELARQNVIIYSLLAVLALAVLVFFFWIRNYRLNKENEIARQNHEIDGQRLKISEQKAEIHEQRALISEQKIKELIRNQELATFTAMIEGQEKERNRIASELHDRLGAMLSMVKLHFKSVEEEIKKLNVKNIDQYAYANKLLDEACDEVRKVAQDLTSGVLTNFGLEVAIEELKTTIESTGFIQIKFISIGLSDRLPFDLEINIYRIIQELLTNAIKHANATEMTIQVFKKKLNTNIMVEDNGIGFDPSEVKHAGMGLKNIFGRVTKMDGEITIDSGKGAGTTITIDIPTKEIDE